MTLILGVEDGDRSIVFSDSGAWTGGFTQELAEPKIWRCGGWVIGTSGPIADTQSMRRRDIAEPNGAGRFECLSKWVNGVLREIHQRNLALGVDRKEISSSVIIAAHSGRVWEVDPIGAVTRTTAGFAMAGYYEEAAGAMLAFGQQGQLMSAFERGSRSMLIARSVNAKIHGRIDWKSTDGDEGSIA